MGDALSSAHQLLNQVNVLILPNELISKPADDIITATPKSSQSEWSTPPYVDILLHLKSKGVNILGIREVWFDTQQAQEVLQSVGHKSDKINVSFWLVFLMMFLHVSESVVFRSSFSAERPQ